MIEPPTRGASCAPASERYDVIVSDNFHPARSGSAALYTVEHFAAVRERLRRGGVFCQWLPLHQLDMPDAAQHRAHLYQRLSARLGRARHAQPRHAGHRADRAPRMVNPSSAARSKGGSRIRRSRMVCRSLDSMAISRC